MARDVAILVGSLRKESFTRKIAKTIAGMGGDELAFRFVEIGDAAALQSGSRYRCAAGGMGASFAMRLRAGRGGAVCDARIQSLGAGRFEERHRCRLAALWQKRVCERSRRRW